METCKQFSKMVTVAIWSLTICLTLFSRWSSVVSYIVTEKIDEPVELSYPPVRRSIQNINCDHFSEYASNCAMNAAAMYNSNQKSPPTPKKILDWCSAIKYLTNCASEWNIDCRDVTDSHFNEESLNGHGYVVHNICEDKKFIENYMNITGCVENTASHWEVCYITFKGLVDGFKKNTTSDWTHYETHFYLCCARAKFRRCVLDVVFNKTSKCTRSQAVMLQKFSVIVSEGDVYQDCDFNMVYSNCPEGDPRPSPNYLGLKESDDLDIFERVPSPLTDQLTDNADFLLPRNWFCTFFVTFVLCLNIFL